MKIYDDEGLQASELLGCAQIRLNELEPGKVKDVWLKLVKDLDVQRDVKNRGQVRINSFEYCYCRMEFCPFYRENSTNVKCPFLILKMSFLPYP